VSLIPLIRSFLFPVYKLPFIDTKNPRKGFITSFKAFTSLITINCILAVDFLLFPRELAKTESYGISLMDLGVGAVIFSMGVTAPRFFTQPFVKVLKSSILVALIGILRTVVVKFVGYHVKT
jgi:phosphatidylinositol glycan class W